MRSLLGIGIGLGVLLAASVGASVAFGSEPVALGEVYGVLGHKLGLAAPPDPIVERIVWRLRLPRVLLAVLVGGGLSIVGVGMQTLVRNPLAEPYVLGISSGASAGASLFFLGFLPPLISTALTLPLAAFFGGLGTLVVVYAVARTATGVSVARLLLAGVAMSALMASVTAFVTFASPEPQKLQAVLFWLLGSLHRTTWGTLPAPAAASALGLALMLALARPLDALLMGDEPAHSLGVPVETVKRGLIVLAALLTGALVAASGAIGFVGLIVPHAVRSVVGVSHRRLVPISFLAGALFLVWADVAARALLPEQQLPVGVVTALCGVPFFLVLLRRSEYAFG